MEKAHTVNYPFDAFAFGMILSTYHNTRLFFGKQAGNFDGFFHLKPPLVGLRELRKTDLNQGYITIVKWKRQSIQDGENIKYLVGGFGGQELHNSGRIRKFDYQSSDCRLLPVVLGGYPADFLP